MGDDFGDSENDPWDTGVSVGNFQDSFSDLSESTKDACGIVVDTSSYQILSDEELAKTIRDVANKVVAIGSKLGGFMKNFFTGKGITNENGSSEADSENSCELENIQQSDNGVATEDDSSLDQDLEDNESTKADSDEIPLITGFEDTDDFPDTSGNSSGDDLVPATFNF